MNRKGQEVAGHRYVNLQKGHKYHPALRDNNRLYLCGCDRMGAFIHNMMTYSGRYIGMGYRSMKHYHKRNEGMI